MVASMENLQQGLVDEINHKLRRCRMRTELLLRMKYSRYKTVFDRASIFIIVLSSLTAVYETIRTQLSESSAGSPRCCAWCR